VNIQNPLCNFADPYPHITDTMFHWNPTKMEEETI